MEKRKPTHDLISGTAVRTAAALGFGRREMVDTIQTIQRRHFYKSMTAHADHRN